jgi:molybdate transport system ATP-binding protein
MKVPDAQAPKDAQAMLVHLDNATISRTGGYILFHGLTWTIREGEVWALAGPVGSGKTALAEVLLGRHLLDSGQIGWPLVDRVRAGGRPVAWPSDIIQNVPFKEDTWLFSYARHYYQQRFNFIEPQDDLTLESFLRSGTSVSAEEVSAVAGQLGIASLLPLSLIALSSGQVRRARIARALLARPELLILDEPFVGLDTAGRAEVTYLLENLLRQGLRLLLITRPHEIPPWVTHVLELGPLATVWQGLREDYQTRLPAETAPPPARCPSRTADTPAIIEMRDVHIAYGNRVALSGVSWVVRQGERWAVLGPNGSGKTTLLSLICGDHPQAYSNDIRLFGHRRGTGESIWEIKQRIGLVSPELHLYFSEPLTADRVVATGFFDVLVSRPISPAQNAVVRELFDQFGIAALSGRLFSRLSTGEQRLVLLIRALVKRPPLLILDEPFQCLDEELAARVRNWIDSHLGPDQTLIFVSHYEGEIPRSVDQRLRLEQGRVVESW